MTFSAALYGGPQDGNVYALKEDEMTVKFAQMESPVMEATEEGPYEVVKWKYIQYLRTNEFTEKGDRIYRYVPNG